MSLSSLSGSSGEGEHERETPKRKKPKADPSLFEKFWDAYGKKVARGAAEKAWNSQVGADAELAEVVIAAARRASQTPDFTKDNRKFQPHPSTWLHAKRWNDEMPSAPGSEVVDPEYTPEMIAEMRADVRRRTEEARLERERERAEERKNNPHRFPVRQSLIVDDLEEAR